MPAKSDYWSDPEKHRAKTRAYAKANPEWKKKSNRDWLKTEKGRQFSQARTRRLRDIDPSGYLFDRLRRRAIRDGLPFDLEAKDIIIPDACPVLGLPFEWGKGQMGWRNMRSPSVDKIRPQLGYVKGNIRVISNRANHLKSNGTIEELEAVLAYMKREGANQTLEEQEAGRAPVAAEPTPQLEMGW